MSKTLKSSCSLLAVSTAMLAGGITPAALADDDDKLNPEEIVVTATRRETKLMDTPIAITAVSQRQLDVLNISDVKALKLQRQERLKKETRNKKQKTPILQMRTCIWLTVFRGKNKKATRIK